MKSNKKFLMFLMVMSMLFTVYENVREFKANEEKVFVSEMQLSEHTVSVSKKESDTVNGLQPDMLQAGVEVVLHADFPASKIEK